MKTPFLVRKNHDILPTIEVDTRCYQIRGMVYKTSIAKDRIYQYRGLPVIEVLNTGFSKL